MLFNCAFNLLLGCFSLARADFVGVEMLSVNIDDDDADEPPAAGVVKDAVAVIAFCCC